MDRYLNVSSFLIIILISSGLLGNISLSAQTAALLVVDIQTDFTDSDQYLSKVETEVLLDAANRVISLFQARDLPVIYTKAKLRKLLISPDGEKRIVKEASGLHPKLRTASDLIFVKPKADALRSPDVFAALRERGVEKVFVIGLMAEDCLSKTALGAVREGFRAFVVDNAVGAFSPESRAKRFRKMEKKKITLISLQALTGMLD